MVSREHKRDALHDKLQILRSITHSHAASNLCVFKDICWQMNDTSIVVDASNYIKELKHKVEILNEEIATAESSNRQNMWPRVSVETLEKGILVNVHSGRSCPGLLVLILATFEELGLSVLEARVSCAHTFHLQALGGQSEEEEVSMDAQMVKRTISNTIKNWRESNGIIVEFLAIQVIKDHLNFDAKAQANLQIECNEEM